MKSYVGKNGWKPARIWSAFHRKILKITGNAIHKRTQNVTIYSLTSDAKHIEKICKRTTKAIEAEWRRKACRKMVKNIFGKIQKPTYNCW